MPLLSSSYKIPNGLWKSVHIQTALPSLMRRIVPIFYKRERFELEDGDFVDVDFNTRLPRRSNKLMLICHGLEGSSRAPYAKGMARAAKKAGWDIAMLNFRSCSGEMNRLALSYHSGETQDLDFVFNKIINKYETVSLLGFSLGGNVVLKYLGELGTNFPSKLIGAVTYSVPCDLAGSSDRLKEPENSLYMKRFLRKLKRKVRLKHQRGDWISSPESMKDMSSFREFDEQFTAPLHGFKSAEDYYQKNSSLPYLPKIAVPTLLINAKNDPFLSQSCYPEKEAGESEFVFLETPKEGGHCGFPTGTLVGTQWHEQRGLDFLAKQQV